MEEKLLAILEEENNGDINSLFTIDSDEIDFDMIPKKSDLKKNRRSGVIKKKSVLDLSESDKIEKDDTKCFFVDSESEIPKVETKVVINTQGAEEIDYDNNSDVFFHEEENNDECVGGIEDNHNIGNEFVTEFSFADGSRRYSSPDIITKDDKSKIHKILKSPQDKTKSQKSEMNEGLTKGMDISQKYLSKTPKINRFAAQNSPRRSSSVIYSSHSKNMHKSPLMVKFSTGITPPSKNIEDMTSIELVEHTLSSYLERILREASRIFLDELNYLMNDALSYEKMITSFTSDLNKDIKHIINDIYADGPSLKDISKRLTIQIGDQISNAKKLLSSADDLPNKQGNETLLDLNSYISKSTKNIREISNSSLPDVKREAFTLSFVQDSEIDFSQKMSQLKSLLDKLESRRLQLDFEYDFLSKQSSRFKQMQISYREKLSNIFNNNDNFRTARYVKDLNKSIKYMIKDVKKSITENPIDIALLTERVHHKVNEVNMLNNSMIIKNENLLHKISMSYVDERASSVITPLDISIISNDNLNSTRNDVVANVRQRLEKLKRRSSSHNNSQSLSFML